LMYAPQGCSYISFCTHLNHSEPNSGLQYLPNLLCTNMCEKDVIFGGTTHLKETLKELLERFPKKPIFLITSCPAGLIGDDVNSVIDALNTEEQKIFHVSSDGVIGGDFYSGTLNAYKMVAKEFIDNTVLPEENTVNLIGEQNLSTTADQNFLAITQLLADLGIKINCRFIRYTDLTKIKNFKKARLSIPIINEPTVQPLIDYLYTNFNTETLEVPPPIAFEQSSEFVRLVANRFGKEKLAEKIINDAKMSYNKQILPLKTYFAGKKILIFNSAGGNIDWLLSTMIDLDVNIAKVYDSNFFYPQQRTSPKYSKINFESNYPLEKYGAAVREFCPDFVLTVGSINQFNNVACDTFPVSPLYGFYSGLDYAKKLQMKLKIPFREGWRIDEQL
jgi:nitrogenase iron protein NifH